MNRKSPLRRSTKPLKRSAISHVPKNKSDVRVGKTGVVRLSGDALKGLRDGCYLHANSICQRCGKWTFFDPRFDGDPDAYDMAHIKSRGAGGSDTMDNVRCLCHACHMREHKEGRRNANRA